jgi:hypothetical protein
MPRFETFHGDEEKIEACSDRFYEVLQPHFCLDTGVLDTEKAAVDIELAAIELATDLALENVPSFPDGLPDQDVVLHDPISLGFLSAVETLNDLKAFNDWHGGLN